MSLKRTIEIDGRQVPFKASAAIPRIYRMKFQRDIFRDLRALEKAVDKENPEESSLDLFSLEMFENIAYVMAKHADPSVPDTPEEWLDGFNTFSIYQILPQIIDLWGLNVKTDVESKKNFARLNGRLQRRSSSCAVCSLASPSATWGCSPSAWSTICTPRAAMTDALTPRLPHRRILTVSERKKGAVMFLLLSAVYLRSVFMMISTSLPP